MIRIACVQSNVVFGDPSANTKKAIADLEFLKEQGVQLAVFPEAFLTGYCVECAEDARQIGIQASELEDLRRACDRLDMMAVVGFAEREGDTLFNSAALLEPDCPPRVYRKSHLPELGLDKFVGQGKGPLQLFETRIGKIGVLICFDMRFPEATRMLALQGADLIVLPTNWPEGAEVSADHIAIARAAENRVFFATCNRVGEENGFRFIGRSKIVSPTGQVLAAAGGEEETIIADLDFALARQKRTVAIPGKYETEVFKARRPDLYSGLDRDFAG